MNWLSDVYLLNAEALANELRSGAVSEGRAVKHVIVAIVLGGLGFDVPISVDWKGDVASGFRMGLALSTTLVGALVTYYGMWLTYQVNQKGDGKDFFLRFAVLSLPVGIYLALVFLIVGALLVGGIMILSVDGGIIGYYLGLASFAVASLAFAAMFFLRMRAYIAIASGA